MNNKEVLAEYLKVSDINKIIARENCEDEWCNIFEYEDTVYKISDIDNISEAFYDEMIEAATNYIDRHVNSSLITEHIDIEEILNALLENYYLSDILDVTKYLSSDGEGYFIGKCYEDCEYLSSDGERYFIGECYEDCGYEYKVSVR